MRLKPSAIGILILVTPLPQGNGYYLNYFSLSGYWSGSCMSAGVPWTKRQATKERQRVLQWHKKLAAQRVSRRKRSVTE